MKRTSLDAINILYLFIAGSELMTGIHKPNGGLYKQQRPINSVQEDVVINSITLNHLQVQSGVLNVNIHVPNLALAMAGIVDTTQPNFARLTQLGAIASGLLNCVWEPSGEWTFEVQQDNIFEDVNNQYYLNFRINFYSRNN